MKGIQPYNRFQIDFSGAISKVMSKNLLQNRHRKQRKIYNIEHGKNQSSELHSIPIRTEVTQQIGINICSLLEVDGFKHLVVCIDYFSK